MSTSRLLEVIDTNPKKKRCTLTEKCAPHKNSMPTINKQTFAAFEVKKLHVFDIIV